MTNEILSSGLPQYVAAYAIGHGLGAVADQVAIKRAEKSAQLLQSENMVDPTVLRAPSSLAAAVERATNNHVSSTPTKLETAKRSLLSPVAGFAGTSAVLLAYGLLPGAAIETTPPKIGIVVDHSFDTTVGDKPAITRINQIVEAFDDSKVNASPLVASSGEYLPIAIEDVAKSEPFGGAPLKDATTFALKSKNSAVVIATNGNPIGSPAAIIAAANKAKTPIYVVNVESEKEANKQTEEGLKQIAKDTKGKYWENNAANADKIASDVKTSVIPTEIQRVKKTGRDEALGLAAVAAFFGIATYRKRSSLTLSSKKLKG